MFRFLLEKEFKYILRDPFLSRMVFMLPVVMMLVLPWAANQEVKNLEISIIDHDKTSYSSRLGNKIGSSGYFIVAEQSANYQEGMLKIEKGDADILVEIESEFEKKLVTKGKANILISANAVNSMNGSLGSYYISSIIQDFNRELEIGQGIHSEASMIQVFPQYKFNPSLDYKIFMVPAILVILLTVVCGFLPALSIVSEKEQGTIEQINVTPVGKFQFIFAKLIPFWIMGMIILTLCFAISALVYNLTPESGYLRVYAAACFYILAVSGLGLIISNYSQTMQQAIFVAFFIIMIFILMSGLFTPISSMPQWAQDMTLINPLRYFIQAMRMLFLKGSTLLNIMPQLLPLLGFAIVFNFWAILTYKKTN